MTPARPTRGGRLEALIEGYLDYQRDVRRRTPGTVKDNRCTLKRASTVLGSQGHGRPLAKARLADLLAWLETEREAGRSATTLAKMVSHVRGFLDYAWRSGRADRNVLDGFQLADATPRQEPESLSVAEAARLVQACPAGTPEARRDRVMILLLYGCGLRTSELCGLDVHDVLRDRKELLVRRGKGDRERVVPVPGGVWTELLAYLVERGGRRGPLLRTMARRCRVTPKDVGRVVHRVATRAGLGGEVTAKTLRHSYATHLMDAGVDLAVIASLMGHRSPVETGVYLHVLEGRPRRAVDQLDATRRSRKGGTRP
jgi:site-specific recombinase XerD